MAPVRLATLLAALGVLAPAARADSLNDYLGPREIAIGESLRADARGGQATTLNPAGLALGGDLVFEGSYGYRSADGASAASVSACDSTVPVPGCFYYHYFTAAPSVAGTDEDRRAHEGGFTLSRAISPRVAMGMTTKYFDYESSMPGEEDASGFTFDVGAVAVLSPSFNLAAVGYNLWGKESVQYPRAVAGGIMARPMPALGLGFDALWNLDADKPGSSGRFGGGGEYFVSASNRQSGYPIRAGGIYDQGRDAGYVTAGLGFMSLKLGVDVGGRVQVSGGDELMIQASLRLFGPRPAPGSSVPQ
jgi:hypothetical protein